MAHAVPKEPNRERVSWERLKERVLHRDGHRCRNCASEKYLEVHHWLPLPGESVGIDRNGYRTNGPHRIVPESGLITLCKNCHNVLHEARTISRISEDASNLGPVAVPVRDWHNIFELWELNGRKLPMKVIRENWNETVDHFLLVESIEIRRWPFGFAWGRYHRNGQAGVTQKIGSSGSYEWKVVM